MKTIFNVIPVLIALGSVGCNTTRDLSSQPENRTNYAIGQIYELKKPVFLFKSDPTDSKEIARLEKLGASGTASDLEGFRRQAPLSPHVAGLLMPGDQVQVTKLVEHSSPTVGTFLDVVAVVVSQGSRGQIVEISLISKEGLPGYRVFINPEYLVPVK